MHLYDYDGLNNVYTYVNGNPISYTDPMGLMGSRGSTHPVPDPDRECMQRKWRERFGEGVAGDILKEFSLFSLLPSGYNIEGDPMKSVVFTGLGVQSKFAAYWIARPIEHWTAQLIARGLHIFGAFVSGPVTLYASNVNATIAKECTCQK